LLSFKEKVRPEALETLEYFRSQGVGVRILSGDHPQTVANVARAAGLRFEGQGFDARMISGAKIDLSEILEKEFVLGRVTPDQKKDIVTALQSKGHVVAMVGDGVNDSLALKQSDLGIAMGSGSALTRGAANLVLLDNRFATLPKIVGEGRRVIANVERLASLFLTKTVWALILAIVFSVLLWQYPTLPRQLSATDGFTIGIPAFLLALLPNQKRYKPGFLKRALFFCIPAGLATASAIIVLGTTARHAGGWSAGEMQTATAILLSITGLWVLGTLVRPINGVKLLILLSMALTALLAFVIPFSAEFFEFTSLSREKLVLTASIALTASAAIELSRYLVDRLSR
jgi:cation-transporting ATPase E